MDKSEKRILKNRNRRLKQRQKAQIREEKRSIKKQKRELKALRRKHNKQQKHYNLFNRVLLFFTHQGHEQEAHHSHQPGLIKRVILKYREQKSFKRNKKEARFKQKNFAKLRSRQIKKEKVHRKSERKHMREKIRPMRKKIRAARLRHFKEQVIGFLRQPIKVKKLKEEEKILRKQIKDDLKQQRREALQKLPENISASFAQRMRIRREKFNFFMMNMNSSLSGRRALKEDPLLRGQLIKTFVNSAFTYVLAFLLLYFSSKLVSIWIAGLYGIPAVLYSFRIFWPLYTYSSLYSRQALILIFAAGPVFSLIVGLLFYRVFYWLRFRNLNLKLLLLWTYFHALNLFFGAYISGVITRTDFVYATEWLFYSQVFDVEEIIFVILSLIILLVAGFYLARKFIIASGSISIINPRVRLFYMIASVLGPWMIGSGVLYFLNFPKNPPELLLIYATTALMTIPAMTNFNSVSNRAIKIVLNRQGIRIGWIYILFCILLVFAIRMVVFNGVSFR